MRFDDGLDTVLAMEMAGPLGIQSVWRQVVDLLGRRRGGPHEAALNRLRLIRNDVPVAVRAASARGLERANPPAALVALFSDDEAVVAAPVVRSARLTATEWVALLPGMRPETRGVLRHRRDLSETVTRALASFGPSDFALPSADLTKTLIEPTVAVGVWPPPAPAIALDSPAVEASHWSPEPAPTEATPPEAVAAAIPAAVGVWPPPDHDLVAEPTVPATSPVAEPGPAAVWPPLHEVATLADPAEEADAADPRSTDAVAVQPTPTFIPPEPEPFVAVADVVRDLPVVTEALRLASEAAPPPPSDDDFRIAAIVARIEAHQRIVDEQGVVPAAPAVQTPSDRFRFETDAAGIIRWCDGVERGPVIGLSLAAGRDGAAANVDAIAGGALARRARFADAHLTVPGSMPVGGGWRISATPVFDHASGRFTGYRGVARRPRPDEEPRVAGPTPATDALRQLVHELRTPANAISGFAEMIEREMLGPVAAGYRAQAAAIRNQTAGLLDAIADIDTAARIESGSLDLRVERVPLAPLLTRVMAELHPLAELRGAFLTLDVVQDAVVAGDAVAAERMFARLLTAIVASAGQGETVRGAVVQDGDTIRCELSRPAALAIAEGGLFSADAEQEARAEGAPLLGGGFAFRLARRLIAELGGSLAIGTDSLTVRLPAAVDRNVEQATV